jgi:hypothetical protein
LGSGGGRRGSVRERIRGIIGSNTIHRKRIRFCPGQDPLFPPPLRILFSPPVYRRTHTYRGQQKVHDHRAELVPGERQLQPVLSRRGPPRGLVAGRHDRTVWGGGDGVVKGLRERVRREYDGSGSRSKMIMAADTRCWRCGVRNRVCTQKSRHNYSSLCKR